MKQEKEKALIYNYVSRKVNKRDNRKKNIITLNSGLIIEGISYSSFISSLNNSNIKLSRGILSNLVINENVTFNSIIKCI